MLGGGTASELGWARDDMVANESGERFGWRGGMPRAGEWDLNGCALRGAESELGWTRDGMARDGSGEGVVPCNAGAFV